MTRSNYEAREFYRNEAQARHYAEERFAGGRRATHRRDLAALDAVLPRTQSRLVLDCPSGTGRVSRPLKASGLTVAAADVSLEMLAEARNADSAHYYVQADALALPFRDAAFDAVVSMRFIYHLPLAGQRIKALSEMARVSRRYVAVSFFDARTIQGARARIGKWLSGEEHTRHLLSLEQFRSEAARAGLKVVAVKPTLKGISEHTVVLFEKATEAQTAAAWHLAETLAAARAAFAASQGALLRAWHPSFLILAALAVALYFLRVFELENDAIVWTGGVSLLAAGLFLRARAVRGFIADAFSAGAGFRRFAKTNSVSWVLLVSGVTFLSELVWLVPLIWLAYLTANRPIVAAAGSELVDKLKASEFEFNAGAPARGIGGFLSGDFAMAASVVFCCALMALKEIASEHLLGG